MGDYGFANIIAGNQGMFGFLILLIFFSPLIIGCLRPSKYLNGISWIFVISFVFNLLVSPRAIGFEAYLLIGVALFIAWFVSLVLAFIKDDKK